MNTKTIPLSLYINDKEKLSAYSIKLAHCVTARMVAQTVMEMFDDPWVKIDRREMVKARFIMSLLPIAHNITTSVANIRKSINAEYDRQMKVQRMKHIRAMAVAHM